jgi:hypothetical protein
LRFRWSKELSDTEALKNQAQSIGEIRFGKTKQKFPIHRDFFKDVFFSGATWSSETRTTQAGQRGKKTGIHQEAFVEFAVQLPGDTQPSRQSLMVKHVPERHANQYNYVTAIKWGPLSSKIRAFPGKGLSGKFVVVERYEDGSYSLRVTDEKPDPLLILAFND